MSGKKNKQKPSYHLRTSVAEITNVVSEETGEVKDVAITKLHRYLAGNSESFVFAYVSLLNMLSSWKLTMAAICMYAYLIEKYPDGTPFSINSFIREELSERTGKSQQTFTHATKELVSNKLIYEVSFRVYKLNPSYAWRGDKASHKKAIIELIEDCPDCMNE